MPEGTDTGFEYARQVNAVVQNPNYLSCWGVRVGPLTSLKEGPIWAEIEPAPSWNWRPWRGRTARWWFEVHTTGATWAYLDGGSGGGFTLRSCTRKALAAVHHFAHEHNDV